MRNSISKTLHFVINAKSGLNDSEHTLEILKNLCEEHSYQFKTYIIQNPKDFKKLSNEAIQNCENDNGLLITAGGDGTIRGIVQKIYKKNLRFAIVPTGTFNFFARTHNIPEDRTEALRLALTGNSTQIQLGLVNEHIFLINASLGLYVKIIKERENNTKRFGRKRIIAILSAIKSLLSKHYLLQVKLKVKEKSQTFLTPMIFIGNNALQLRNLNMDISQCIEHNKLAAIMMKPAKKWEIIRMLLRGISKNIEKDEKLKVFCIDDMNLNIQKKKVKLALDGEILTTISPIQIKILPDQLSLIKPLNSLPKT